MTDLLVQETAGGVRRLTLNDLATRNSLSEAMMRELQEALDKAADEMSVRVIVIAAMGTVFSSGHNLKEIAARRADTDGGTAYFETLFDTCANLMTAIVTHPKPVIAEVGGLASAAGCQLVASCDLAIATDTANFCTPGVNIGLFCSTPMVALSRNVSRKHALEMLLTGDVIKAAEALRIGLVNRVVSPNELRDATDELARKIAAKSQAIVKIGKQAFYRQLELPLAEAYAYAARVMVENLMARDAGEGLGAFIGKRQPQWTDS